MCTKCKTSLVSKLSWDVSAFLRLWYFPVGIIEVLKSLNLLSILYSQWKIFCRADDFSFYDATALEKVTWSYFFLLLLFFRCPINYRGMFSLKTTPIHTWNIKVLKWNKNNKLKQEKRSTYVIVLVLFINTFYGKRAWSYYILEARNHSFLMFQFNYTLTWHSNFGTHKYVN